MSSSNLIRINNLILFLNLLISSCLENIQILYCNVCHTTYNLCNDKNARSTILAALFKCKQDILTPSKRRDALYI